MTGFEQLALEVDGAKCNGMAMEPAGSALDHGACAVDRRHTADRA